MYKFLSSLLIILCLAGCSPKHESPTSEIFQNDLPQTGLIIEVSEDGQLANVINIESSLNVKHKKIFNLSMQWIATESDVQLSTLAGKSPYDIVEIANCLKTIGNESLHCIQ